MTAGLEQTQATALPSISFSTDVAGNHNHSTDPVAVNTSNSGSHTHSNNATGTAGNYGLIRRSTSGQNATASAFDTGGSGNEADLISTVNGLTINLNGEHTHTVDMPATTSSSNGNHTHVINGGGDAETRPINSSVVWCLKVKAANTSSSITINSGNISNVTTNGTSGEATLMGSILNIPQYTGSIVGDIKTGIQTADHNGWIKLDGRLTNTLTASQQAEAATLGIGANLPDATDAYLSQNGTALGSVSGNNTKNITQANLPNINLTTSNTGAHTHQLTHPNELDENQGILLVDLDRFGVVIDHLLLEEQQFLQRFSYSYSSFGRK